jgi:hypothetical protein
MHSIIGASSESSNTVQLNGECFIIHGRYKITVPTST